MNIHVEIGPPLIERGDDRAHLRRVQLGVVAIQIEIARVRSPTGHVGAALIDAVVRRSALVSIDIENGDEEKIRPIEQ